MLNNYREFLESNPLYTINYHVAMIEMLVSLLPASAGFSEFLGDEQMEKREFPASSVLTVRTSPFPLTATAWSRSTMAGSLPGYSRLRF